MMYRVLSMVCFSVALGLLVSGNTLNAQQEGKAVGQQEKGVGQAKDEKTHEGKVVRVQENKLIMESKGKEHSHTVPATAKIQIDGRAGKLQDLRPGQQIRVTTPADDMERVLRIEAGTKDRDLKKRDLDRDN